MVDEKKEQECKAKFEDCLTEDTIDSLHTGRHLALIWAVIFVICGILVVSAHIKYCMSFLLSRGRD